MCIIFKGLFTRTGPDNRNIKQSPHMGAVTKQKRKRMKTDDKQGGRGRNEGGDRRGCFSRGVEDKKKKKREQPQICSIALI